MNKQTLLRIWRLKLSKLRLISTALVTMLISDNFRLQQRVYRNCGEWGGVMVLGEGGGMWVIIHPLNGLWPQIYNTLLLRNIQAPKRSDLDLHCKKTITWMLTLYFIRGTAYISHLKQDCQVSSLTWHKTILKSISINYTRCLIKDFTLNGRLCSYSFIG